MIRRRKRPKLNAALMARAHRELAYRRALEHAGYLPQSIEIAVAKDRQWLNGEGWR